MSGLNRALLPQIENRIGESRRVHVNGFQCRDHVAMHFG